MSEYTNAAVKNSRNEWHFSGEKFAWSFRVSDKKRFLIYLLPRDNFFKAAFVFGQKATDEILNSRVSDTIKAELRTARVYGEGRGIRIEVRNGTLLKDLIKLIDIKINS
ncbi:MAG: DUF3788 family protein [Sediminibacterium sp.]